MTSPPMTRRAWLLASGGALSCGRKLATGYSGYCLVADQANRSLVAVDLRSFRAARRIPLDAAPAAITAGTDPNRPTAFALAPDAGAVFEIDAAGLAVRRRASAGISAVAMKLSPSGDALWALYREPALLVKIALDSFQISHRVPLPAPPDEFDISEDGRAAIACRAARSVVLVSLAKGAIEKSISVGAEPGILQFRHDGKQVMVGCAPERSLAIFDVASGKPVVRLPLPCAPRRFAVTPDHGQMFISGDGSDSVSIAFPYNTEIDQSILAGHAPGAMLVTDSSPSYLMVANPESGGVTILDMNSRRLVAVARVGQWPAQILLTPDKQFALVLDRDSADLAVIRLSTLAEEQVRRFKSAPLFSVLSLGGKPVAAAIVGIPG